MTPAARIWLQHTACARVLQVFDVACNLIDEHDNIFSLVTPAIGNGPFAIVVQVDFAKVIDLNTQIAISGATLTLGVCTIDTATASIWNPRPNWGALRPQIEFVRAQLPALTALLHSDAPHGSFASLADAPDPRDSMQDKLLKHARQPAIALTQGIAMNDLDRSRNGATQLAGLGGGLTPSGDDFIAGALYAMWAMRTDEDATAFAQPIIDAAIPRTTHLSAAWLRAAARGEAVESWHHFIDALTAHNHESMLNAARKIIHTGHTSGADALAGFVSTLQTSV